MNKSLVILFLATLLNFKAASSFPKYFEFSSDQTYDSIDPFDMPDGCLANYYCTAKGDEYPQEDVDELLKKLSMEYEEVKSFGPGAFDPESDCQAVYSRAPIYYIKDESDKTRVVVQSSDPNGFHQFFDLRVCAFEGRLHMSRYFLKTSGYEVTCNTSYLPFDFFVLGHGEELMLERITVPLPVCCKCLIKKRA